MNRAELKIIEKDRHYPDREEELIVFGGVSRDFTIDIIKIDNDTSNTADGGWFEPEFFYKSLTIEIGGKIKGKKDIRILEIIKAAKEYDTLFNKRKSLEVKIEIINEGLLKKLEIPMIWVESYYEGYKRGKGEKSYSLKIKQKGNDSLSNRVSIEEVDRSA